MSQTLTYTYDLSTTIGRVRLLIPDRATPDQVLAGNVFFSDEELEAFAALEEDNPKRTAACALEVMASDEVYVQKVMTVMDVHTNGALVSQELRARARDLRLQAITEDADAGVAFDWAEQVTTDANARERWLDQALRDNL